mgnify:CR=1 FL=1
MVYPIRFSPVRAVSVAVKKASGITVFCTQRLPQVQVANTVTTADTIGTIAGLTAFGAVVAHGGVTLAKHKYDTIQLEKKIDS